MTDGEDIFFAAGAYDPASPAGRLLVLHELAHVLQKRAGADRPPAGEAALEREADRFALSLLTGRPDRVRLRDASGQPRLWGCAGHYYTVYLVYLNAGASDDEAFRTALYCWMPDQVRELDAYRLAMGLVEAVAVFDTMRNTAVLPPGFGWIGRLQQMPRRLRQYKSMEAIHRGIHCLTGRPAEQETRIRLGVLANPLLSPVMRGMAHHPLGDSFAHRRFGSGVMWDAGLGHGLEKHKPDETHWRERGAEYHGYLLALSDLAQRRTGKRPILAIEHLLFALNPIVHVEYQFGTVSSLFGNGGGSAKPSPTGSEDLDRRLLQVGRRSVGATEAARCDHLARIASDLLGRPMRDLGYDPLREPVPWRDWYLQHKGILDRDVLPRGSAEKTSAALLAEIVAHAHEWAGAVTA